MNHANMNANETFLGLLEVQNEMQIACGKWTNFPRNECNFKCACVILLLHFKMSNDA